MSELQLANLRELVELVPLFCLAALVVALLVPMVGGLLSAFLQWFWGER